MSSPKYGKVDLCEYEALRARVVELEMQVDFLLRELKLTYTPPDDEFRQQLRAMAKQGKMLEALQLYRQKYDASLEEARRYLGG